MLHNTRQLLATLAAVAALTALAGARGPATATDAAGAQVLPSGTFLLRHVRIFDGERVIRANAVLVEDGKSVRVGRDLAAPAGVPAVDGTGDTRTPIFPLTLRSTRSPTSKRQPSRRTISYRS